LAIFTNGKKKRRLTKKIYVTNLRKHFVDRGEKIPGKKGRALPPTSSGGRQGKKGQAGRMVEKGRTCETSPKLIGGTTGPRGATLRTKEPMAEEQ